MPIRRFLKQCYGWTMNFLSHLSPTWWQGNPLYSNQDLKIKPDELLNMNIHGLLSCLIISYNNKPDELSNMCIVSFKNKLDALFELNIHALLCLTSYVHC
jgi:hypothetical protein